MRAAIYARVSTGKQAANDLSIPDQIAQCERYCETHGWQVGTRFIDAGVSATTDNRPEFQAMIAEAKSRARPFDVILVHSQSRFARNTLDLLHYKNLLRKADVSLISITQDIGSGEQADVLSTMLGAMDEYQSKETSKHVKRSMSENAKQGFWNGATPPFGYRTYEAEKRGIRSKKKLETNPTEAEIVKLIYRLYVYGDGTNGPLGIKGIANYLNQRDIFNRNGCPFRIQLLQKILRNTAYVTLHYFNKRDSKSGKVRPESDWIPLEVPRIIDDYLFQIAQNKLDKQNPLKTAPRTTNSNVLLTGFSFCAECGSPLRLQTGKNNQYRYYKCSKKADHGASICAGCSMPDQKLDDLVMTALFEQVITEQRITPMLSALLARSSESRRDCAQRLKAITTEKRAVDKKLGKLYDLITADEIDHDNSLSGHIRALQQQRETLIRQATMLEAQRSQSLKPLPQNQVEKFAQALRNRLLDGNDKKFAKAYLKTIIERIDVSRDEVRIAGKKSSLANHAIAFDESKELVPFFDQQWRTRQDSNL